MNKNCLENNGTKMLTCKNCKNSINRLPIFNTSYELICPFCKTLLKIDSIKESNIDEILHS